MELGMALDTLIKCPWDNSINVPEVPGNYYIFSCPLLIPINGEGNILIPWWQENGWVALQSERMPAEAEIHGMQEKCAIFSLADVLRVLQEVLVSLCVLQSEVIVCTVSFACTPKISLSLADAATLLQPPVALLWIKLDFWLWSFNITT